VKHLEFKKTPFLKKQKSSTSLQLRGGIHSGSYLERIVILFYKNRGQLLYTLLISGKISINTHLKPPPQAYHATTHLADLNIL